VNRAVDVWKDSILIFVLPGFAICVEIYREDHKRPCIADVELVRYPNHPIIAVSAVNESILDKGLRPVGFVRSLRFPNRNGTKM